MWSNCIDSIGNVVCSSVCGVLRRAEWTGLRRDCSFCRWRHLRKILLSPTHKLFLLLIALKRKWKCRVICDHFLVKIFVRVQILCQEILCRAGHHLFLIIDLGQAPAPPFVRYRPDGLGTIFEICQREILSATMVTRTDPWQYFF